MSRPLQAQCAKEDFCHLEVKGFRRLYDINIPLRPLTIMIGANGVGKTSLLDVIDLLAVSANAGLNKRISTLSGVNALLTIDKAKDILFGIDMQASGNGPLKYKLELEVTGTAYGVASEQLSQLRDTTDVSPFLHIDSHFSDVKYHDVESHKFIRPTWDHNPLESSLSQVPKMFKQPEDFRKRLGSSTFYHVLNVGARAPVRLPQPLRPAELPGKDGEDIVSCLFYLRETDRDAYDAVEDALRSAFPGFERLDFPPVAAGTLAMTWKDKNFSTPLYMHQLSEGTLRFLWLVALLQSPGLASVTLLDEPEVSLHPELLSQLADLFREASTRSQIIVATHSDRLVKFLNPDEVLVMDLNEEGTTSAQWADTLDLAKWLEEYTLDEIWRMGRMGGRA
jgi:predicted ATPase